MIARAEEIERQQWCDFESKFRSMHEASLAYRFLPETEEELAVVVKAFPAVTLQGKAGSLALDHQQLHFSGWPNPIEYREISGCSVDHGTQLIQYQRDGKQKQKLKLNTFGAPQQEVLNAINHYWGRYQRASAYQAQKRSEKASAGQAATEV